MAIAHVVGRTSFGPYPGTVEALVDEGLSPDDVVDAQLAAEPIAFEPTAVIDGVVEVVDVDAIGMPDPPDLSTNRRLIQLDKAFRPWWLRRMQTDAAGLHEKMMWFWHGHFTTAVDKVDDTPLCWRNLRLLHRHALGNFGDLAKAVTIDGAMLRFLDGADSRYPTPNENYARELMELFMTGPGPYTQDDVVAAANALAGWMVDQVTQEVTFRPEYALDRPVTFLGRRGRFTSDDVVDAILDQEECAPFIVTKIWRAFVGGPPDTDVIARWADGFRSSGYEIAPLMAEILHSAEFHDSRGRRLRSAVEWYCAAVRSTGSTDSDVAVHTARLGQTPYHPPNVAGWPPDEAWAGPSQAHARTAVLAEFSMPVADELARERDLVGAVLRRCSIFEVGEPTVATLSELDRALAASPSTTDRQRAANVLAAACMSPEFLVL